MDSKDNFLKKLREFIEIVDTEYLIGASNKGIVNRADKDLAKTSNIEYEINDENIEFKFEDITCSITDEIQKYKCSCPSRSICKHIIMSYLYLLTNKDKIFVGSSESITGETGENEHVLEKAENNQESKAALNEDILEEKENKNKLNTFGEENQDSKVNLNEERFLKLKEFPIESIKKVIGEKNFGTLIRRLDFGISANLEEGSIIVVDFNEENIVVKLLDNIENSICTCKSKEICKHKAEALILYKLKKGYTTLDELKTYENTIQYLENDNIKKASSKIKTCIEDILISGLSRIPLTILDTLNNMAIICHNYDLPNFERNLRDIREEFSLYLNKNASFTNERLLNKLTSLYTKAIALETTKDLSKLTLLVGEFKSSYYEVPPLDLYGLGAEKWNSKSGYEGITFYFLENNRKEIFTYTNAIPTYYDNTNKPRRNFKVSAPWDLNCSIEELSNLHFKLVCGKLNSQNRISSSSESKGSAINKSNLKDVDVEKFRYDNWNTLIEKVFADVNIKNNNSNLVFLDIYKFDDSIFDNISQTLRVPIYDKEDNSIEIVVNFSANTKNMIRKIERIAKYKKTTVFLGRVYISQGKVQFYPIIFYTEDGEGENLNI